MGDKKSLEALRELWLNGSSQPTSCLHAFQEAFNSGIISDMHIWRRGRRALTSENVAVAQYSLKFLRGKKKYPNKFFRNVKYSPRKFILDHSNSLDDPGVLEAVIYAIQRIAKKSPQQAVRTFLN